MVTGRTGKETAAAIGPPFFMRGIFLWG